MLRKSRKLTISYHSNSEFPLISFCNILIFVKKIYIFLWFKFSHPDKNPDPESKKLFVKIANAYEVILDLG